MKHEKTVMMEELEARLCMATLTWTGLGNNALWTNPSNWRNAANVAQAPTAGDSLVFSGTPAQTASVNNFEGRTEFNQISFNGSAPFSVSGNIVRLQTGVFVGGSGASPTLALPIAVELNATFMSIGAGATATLTGPLVGTQMLVKSGDGTLRLDSDSGLFVGAIQINGGTLRAQTPLGLGTIAGLTTVASGATLLLGTGATNAAESVRIAGTGVGGLGALRFEGATTWAGPIQIIGGGATQIGVSAGTVTLSGAMTTGNGTSALQTSGPGRLVIGGSAQLAAVTVVSGFLRLATAAPVFGVTTVQSGGSLELFGGVSATMSGLVISGTGPGAASGAVQNTSGSNTINAPISLGASATVTATGGTLTLPQTIDTGSDPTTTRDVTFAGGGNIVVGGASGSGAISGTGGLIKSGTGTLTLSGSGANTYDGVTVVSAGALVSQKGTALGSTARGTTLAPGASLRPDGGVTIAEALSISGSGSQDGVLRGLGGANVLSGDISLAGDSMIATDGTLTLTGAIDTMATQRRLQFAGGGTVTVQGVISGPGRVHHIDSGTLILSGANTYTGETAYLGGTTELRNALAFGAPTGTVILDASAKLVLGNGPGNGGIDYAGKSLSLAGTLISSGGACSWDGPLLISGTASTISASTALTITGRMSGGGNLTKRGAGTVTIGGTTSNDQLGATLTVEEGTVQLAKTGGVPALAGRLIVGDGVGADTVRWLASEQIAPLNIGTTAEVVVVGTGVLNLNGFNESLAAVTLSTGGNIQTGTGVLSLTGPLTANSGGAGGVASISGRVAISRFVQPSPVVVRVNAGTLTPGLDISAVISGTGGLQVEGPGGLRLSGANTFTGDTVANGPLTISGTVPNLVRIGETNTGLSNTLNGSGTIGDVIVGTFGTLEPGVNGTGKMTVLRDVTLNGAQLSVQILGPRAGFDFNQLVISSGVLTLNGAILRVAISSTTSVGDSYTIVSHANAHGNTVGSLNGLIVVGGPLVNVTIGGGISGHDMVVTRTNTLAAFRNRTITSTLDEGGTATLSGDIVDPDVLDTFFLDINWGDGATETIRVRPGQPRHLDITHRYADDPAGAGTGTYQVSLAWRDQNNGQNTDSVTTTVRNVAPVVNAGGDAALGSNHRLSRTGTFADPGDDQWTATVDYGDGGGEQPLTLRNSRSFHLAHTYANPGAFDVIVRVRDDDGDVGQQSFRVFNDLDFGWQPPRRSDAWEHEESEPSAFELLGSAVWWYGGQR